MKKLLRKNTLRYILLFIVIAVFEISTFALWFNKLFLIPMLIAAAYILCFLYVNGGRGI